MVGSGVTIVTGDARRLPFAPRTFQMAITSPPYWGQRDYGFTGQIGMEPTYLEYVATMVEVARDVRRVLKPTGTFWLNMGDTFNTRTIIRPSSHQAGLGHDNESTRLSWVQARDRGLVRYSARQSGLKDKDLMGLPWRVANALVDDGWFLRCDVIWSKRYGSPEHAHDRPSRTHEYVFLLSPSSAYSYDKTACPAARRSVWEIAPAAGDAHSAVFADELVRRCLLSSTDPGDLVLDPFAGSGTACRVAEQYGRVGFGVDGRRYDRPEDNSWRGMTDRP